MTCIFTLSSLSLLYFCGSLSVFGTQLSQEYLTVHIILLCSWFEYQQMSLKGNEGSLSYIYSLFGTMDKNKVSI